MDFYRINEGYVQFFQEYEKNRRGLTKVPNIHYMDRNKFAFGAVLEVNGIKYYVSVSSFDKKQEANILIRIPGDKKEVKGSLRFNYMVPVPDACLEKLVIKDGENTATKIFRELSSCGLIDDIPQGKKKANKIYEMVTENRKQILTDNSCDFKILEQGYQEYINEQSLDG